MIQIIHKLLLVKDPSWMSGYFYATKMVIKSHSSFYYSSLLLQFLPKLASVEREMVKVCCELFIFFGKTLDDFIQFNDFIFHFCSPFISLRYGAILLDKRNSSIGNETKG